MRGERGDAGHAARPPHRHRHVPLPASRRLLRHSQGPGGPAGRGGAERPCRRDGGALLEVAALLEPVRGESARGDRADPRPQGAVSARSARNSVHRLQRHDHRAGRRGGELPGRRCGRASIGMDRGSSCWWRETTCPPNSNCMEWRRSRPSRVPRYPR